MFSHDLLPQLSNGPSVLDSLFSVICKGGPHKFVVGQKQALSHGRLSTSGIHRTVSRLLSLIAFVSCLFVFRHWSQKSLLALMQSAVTMPQLFNLKCPVFTCHGTLCADDPERIQYSMIGVTMGERKLKMRSYLML